MHYILYIKKDDRSVLTLCKQRLKWVFNTPEVKIRFLHHKGWKWHKCNWTFSLKCSLCSETRNLEMRPVLCDYYGRTKKDFWYRICGLSLSYLLLFGVKIKVLCKLYKHVCLMWVLCVNQLVLYSTSFFGRNLYNFCNIIHLILYINVLNI